MTQSTSPKKRHAVVLAAGKSTRFKSEKPKLLHKLCGKPLVCHLLDRLAALDVGRIIVVLGHESESVREVLSDYPVDFALQEEQLGTGHATICAAPALKDLEGSVLVLYGDTPLISEDTLRRLYETRDKEDADEVILTVDSPKPHGYGRIVRDSGGAAVRIVEAQDAPPEEKLIRD
ncbi:MAG: bifunctional UDP-N-acetylglucosamine diphosphorylase/glucosamine-1-phosphate N-acetyltransferase GlmU, partial [Acidobacteria bacterium]